jgi:hypothetical protein
VLIQCLKSFAEKDLKKKNLAVRQIYLFICLNRAFLVVFGPGPDVFGLGPGVFEGS